MLYISSHNHFELSLAWFFQLYHIAFLFAGINFRKQVAFSILIYASKPFGFHPTTVAWILKYILYVFSPELTWRDVQHLIVETSKRHNLQDDFYHWQRNGAGFNGNYTLLQNDISGSQSILYRLVTLSNIVLYFSKSSIGFWTNGCRRIGRKSENMD